jgi:hypothetical protein
VAKELKAARAEASAAVRPKLDCGSIFAMFNSKGNGAGEVSKRWSNILDGRLSIYISQSLEGRSTDRKNSIFQVPRPRLYGIFRGLLA